MPIIRQDAHNVPKINNIIAGSSTECASKLSIFGKEIILTIKKDKAPIEYPHLSFFLQYCDNSNQLN